ncbi:foldase protein PrsA [Companilactobacillus sp. RD055328]|uniref:peptidylprolyl isomerase n=1 Tax=Companilactobacillus sp. RD055328 TaxID=2916634 RepID=UPI001FC8BBC7|nr:peptidylprolyl isomerase [Companilactobacillus sp. RD055328]GKQ42490.1 foldase protein PrsA [Companilactobacillus sp. RD055328]
MSKKFNKLVLGVAALLSVTLVAGCGNSTVATLKGGKVTQQEYYDEMKSSTSGKSTLQSLIISKALESQYGDKVSDSKVNKQYNTYKKQYGSQFSQILAQNGMTTTSFKRSIKTNLLSEVALKDTKKITDEKMKKQWKKYTPKITVEHILVDSEDKAKAIITRLDNGENFEDIAKSESTDTGTKSDGGKMTPFNKSDSTIDSDFREGAFTLEKVGDYTKTPVKSDYGYHVIKLIKKPAKGKMSDHKKDLETEIYASWMQSQTVMQKVISKVLKKADVSIKDSDLKDVLSNYITTSKK